jgi:hypothetical protein
LIIKPTYKLKFVMFLILMVFDFVIFVTSEIFLVYGFLNSYFVLKEIDLNFLILTIFVTILIYCIYVVLKINFFSINFKEKEFDYKYINIKQYRYMEIKKLSWLTLKLRTGETKDILGITFNNNKRIFFLLNNIPDKQKDILIRTLQSNSNRKFVIENWKFIFVNIYRCFQRIRIK